MWTLPASMSLISSAISPRPAMNAVCWQHNSTKSIAATIAASQITSGIGSSDASDKKWKKTWRDAATRSVCPRLLLNSPTKVYTVIHKKLLFVYITVSVAIIGHVVGTCILCGTTFFQSIITVLNSIMYIIHKSEHEKHTQTKYCNPRCTCVLRVN